MPEGHTLFRLARDLTDAFAGDRVRVVSPQGRFATEAGDLDGEVLVASESSGKHLFVEFPAERFIHIHLGLIGKFEIGGVPIPPPFGQVRLRVTNATAYADLRGATQCELIGMERHDAIRATLGPDPLRTDADPDLAWSKISRSHRPIGDLLMDQGVIAGVGNVYRAEVLFRHLIHPLRPGKTLRHKQFQAMWDDLVALMHDGVRTGRIDTVAPEHTPEAMGRAPRVDAHGGEVYVYRRHGQECLVCGAKIRTGTLVGRKIFWCSRCQPAFRSRAVG